MDTGWWQIQCILEGRPVTPAMLSEATRDKIAELIKKGYHAGQIIENNEED